MYYEIYGEGKPLLLIHGNGGSVFSSREQIPFFSKHYKVIAVESRGQGKTNDNSDSLTYDQMADDINAFLDFLKIDSAYIFGQSDGAILGLILAIRYPKKVRIKAPVMIMSGDRDMIDIAHIVEIFTAIPKSQLCVLPGSTHFALRQNAAVFNETIQRFFRMPFEIPNSF